MQRKLLKNAQTKELAEITKRQQEALRALQGLSRHKKKKDHRWKKELAQVTEQHSREIKQNQTTFTEQEKKQEKMQAEEKRAFQEWRDVMTRVHDKSEQDRLDVIPETERSSETLTRIIWRMCVVWMRFWSKKEREVEISEEKPFETSTFCWTEWETDASGAIVATFVVTVPPTSPLHKADHATSRNEWERLYYDEVEAAKNQVDKYLKTDDAKRTMGASVEQVFAHVDKTVVNVRGLELKNSKVCLAWASEEHWETEINGQQEYKLLFGKERWRTTLVRNSRSPPGKHFCRLARRRQRP